MSKDNQKYLYVGAFVHNSRPEVSEILRTDKKVGITNNPDTRTKGLSGTKSPIKFQIIELWDCGDSATARQIEDYIKNTLLKKEKVKETTEWFDDADDRVLVDIRKTIELTHKKEIKLVPPDEFNDKNFIKEIKEINNLRELRLEKFPLLVGKSFSLTSRGRENIVTVEEVRDGKLVCRSSLNNKTYPSLNSAFNDAYKDIGLERATLYPWTNAKDTESDQTPDQIMGIK